MLTLMKLISLACLIFIALRSRETGIASLLLASIILFRFIEFSFFEWAKKNLLIFMFTAFFCGLALVSGMFRGEIEYSVIALDAMRILLMFNLLYAGVRWIGREGGYRIIAAMPSLRVRMFFVLFGRNFVSIARAHRSILDHLRSRLDFRWKNRILIARYYLQNIIEKEMYAYRYHQAVLVARLSQEPPLVLEPETFKAVELFPVMAVTALSAAMLLLQTCGIAR